MSRRPNKNNPVRLAVVVEFLPHEWGAWQWNERSEAGNLGGWPSLENQLIRLTDKATGICVLDPIWFTRVIVYIIRRHGSGGPNGRVRGACIPALRRIGIDLLPGWRAPREETPV